MKIIIIIIKLSLSFLFLLKSATHLELLWTWEISANAGPGTSLYLYSYPEISFPFPSHLPMCLGYCSLSQLPVTNLNCPNFQLPPGSLPHWPQRNCPTYFPSFLSLTLSPHSISNNLCKWILQCQNNMGGEREGLTDYEEYVNSSRKTLFFL